MTPTYKVDGSRILITGASSGLGAACAVEFGKRGARLALVARRKTRLEATARRVRRHGAEVIAVRADLMKPAEIEKLTRMVNHRFGGCDVLINNAGSYMEGLPLVEYDLRDWQEMLDTNARAAFLLCRAFVPGMVERGTGRIVNVISSSTHLADIGPFRVSKIALEVITAVLAAELRGSGVAATAVNPSFMRTETSSKGRNPVVVARAMARLLERPGEATAGRVFDACGSGQKCTFRRRRHGRGRFGIA